MAGCGQKAELHRTHIAVPLSSQSAISGRSDNFFRLKLRPAFSQRQLALTEGKFHAPLTCSH
jgi:hypothetical protein